MGDIRKVSGFSCLLSFECGLHNDFLHFFIHHSTALVSNQKDLSFNYHKIINMHTQVRYKQDRFNNLI